MSSRPSDPHDHLPELFPKGIWEDAGKVVKGTKGDSSLLPQRKPPPERPSLNPTDPDSQGLRIEAHAPPPPAEGEATALDVHEIDGTAVRLEPEEPTQPKMPRHLEFHEKPPVPPRGLDSILWGQAKRFNLKWILGISAGIAAVVIVALSLLPIINRPNSLRPDQKDTLVLADDRDAPEDFDTPYEELVSRPEEATRIFRNFKTTSTKEQLLPMIRNRDTIKPLILARPHRVLIAKRWNPSENARWEVHQTESLPYGVLRGNLPDFSEFEAYFVIEDHQLLIDWKATTGYGTASFDELKAGLGDPAEVRGMIQPAKYFSPVFPEADYRSFMLIAPSDNTAVWCYTHRGSPVNDALIKLCHGGGIRKPAPKLHKVTLRLEHGPDEAMPNQWVIAELLQEEWITP